MQMTGFHTTKLRGAGRMARRRTAIVAAGMACAALASCGKPGFPLQKLDADAVVLAFGDSLTFGKGAGEQDNYPSVLARLSGYTVINAGVSGERTDRGLERLPGELRAHSPDLVILCHGGNDMLQKVDPAETVANLEAMIALIRQSGADVVLVGVPEPGIFLKPAPFYEELARKHRIPFDVEVVGEILADGALKSDYIHPNAQGYQKLAESIATLIATSQSA